MSDEMYCGIGKIPKGKIRGTPEYCLEANQVRYYGLKKIDPDLLSMTTSRKSSLVKEQLKLKRLQDDAKILIKEVKNVDLVLNDDMARESNIKRARKRKDELLIKRDKLVTRIKKQREIVKALEKREDQQNKSSGSKSSSSKSSGSKSSSSKSSSSKSSGSKSSSSKSSGSKSSGSKSSSSKSSGSKSSSSRSKRSRK
ncbi:putative low complexity protein [Acanthamoeba polyphaga moumouvirus]|uniref:Putative low complexity protein n=1 Tax=Acanthamoeba polyphaga moumouvirus TaxID=1269028 RepID=L7RCZ6_9VIRU|nr:putative low complexity protein [Acanthamoeba polyphaga moumouvirus]AGC02111.1 putative low complexity protein [Acanthamoeba polyphaga moumouvirus]